MAGVTKKDDRPAPITIAGKEVVEAMRAACDVAVREKRISIIDARLFILLAEQGIILVEKELRVRT